VVQTTRLERETVWEVTLGEVSVSEVELPYEEVRP
jgi:hypothetical protein